MLQIKFGCNRPAGLGDIHVWMCGRTDARTDAETPAPVPSYKLTLWAFGSGELTMWLCTQRRLRSAWASTQSDQRLCSLHEEIWVLTYPLVAGIRPVWSVSSLSAWAHSLYSDQTGRMPRLIWVFAGRTLIFWFCHVAAQLTYAPNEDSDQLAHQPSLIKVITACMMKYWVLSYPMSTKWRLWLDFADAHQSLGWMHMAFCCCFLCCSSDYYVAYTINERICRILCKSERGSWEER